MHASRFCARWYTIVIAARSRGVIRARGAELARRGKKSTGGFDEFTRCSTHQHADFALADCQHCWDRRLSSELLLTCATPRQL
jgi:hypothetical protein